VIETTPKIPIVDKILEISSDIEALIKQYNPERVVIEKLFFNTNITTGIDVSQVRGVILYQFAKRGIQILEYTPLELKSAICGNGKADKKQLQTAIKIFF
jgi:crossover junction endodeoxyribonuclease RuvC